MRRVIRSCDDRVRRLIKSGDIQMKKLARPLKDESGVTAIEYGLIACFIALVLVSTLPTVKTNLTNIFTKIARGLVTT
jgi:pilus assembly protein Flp/PilA